MNDLIEVFKKFDMSAIITIAIVGYFINSNVNEINNNVNEKIASFRSEVHAEIESFRSEVQVEFKELNARVNDVDKRLYRIEGTSSFCHVRPRNVTKQVDDMKAEQEL